MGGEALAFLIGWCSCTLFATAYVGISEIRRERKARNDSSASGV